LHVGLLADNTFIQIFPNGIIHIKADKKKSLYQTSSKILAATMNIRQICVALQDKELMYFELEDEKLIQIEKKVLDSDIISLDIAPIPEGRQRSKFLAVGCSDNYVRILSVDSDQCLSKISMQILPASPESVSLVEIGNIGEVKQLYLNIGLSNGILIKTCLDVITGALSDIRTRYLGNKGVNIFKIQVQNSQAILASSNKPWLGYNFMSKYYTTVLNNLTIDYASSFSSEICAEGIVALSGNTLKIFSIEKLGEVFSQNILNLRYTPRKMIIHPENNNIIILEADQNVYSKTEKEIIKKEISLKTKDEEYLNLPEEKIGTLISSEGKWGSCLRMVDSYELKTLDLLELEENEAVLSGCIMSFSSTPGEYYLIVGTVKVKIFDI
jgi:splicing factor 3B subunit 3